MRLINRITKGLLATAFLATAASAQPFFENSHLDLTIRTIGDHYADSNHSEYITDTTIDQIGQVVTFRYSSGLYRNVIGVDAIWNGVIPIQYDDKNADNEYGDDVFFHDRKGGYQKMGATVRIHPTEDILIRAGRMESHHVLLGPGDYRTTPRMYEMAQGEFGFGPVTMTLIHATGASNYSDDEFHDFGPYKGRWQDGIVTKEPVQIADLKFQNENLSLTAAYGRQKDLMKYTFLETSYYAPVTDDFSIEATAGYRIKDVDEEKFSKYDHELHMWGGQVIATYRNVWVNLAYSQVEKNPDFFEHLDGTMGVDWKLDGQLLAGCKDGGYYTTGVVGVFNHDGERAWKAEVGYDVETGILSGLTASVYYVNGEDLHDGYEYSKNQRQQEWGGIVTYTPELLPDLTLELKHGANTMKSDGEWGMNQDRRNTQLIAVYTIALF